MPARFHRDGWLTRAWLALLLVGVFAARAAAQDGADPRERWDKLSQEERERLRRRFDELQRMSPDERRAVTERFERMRAFERGAREQFSAEAERDFKALDPRAQRDAMRGLVEREFAERGRAMREMMPHEWREKFEQASPREREHMLDKFREHVRGDRLEHVLRDLARRLDLPPTEVERVRSLPPQEQERELFSLERRAIEHDVDTRGLPPWMTQEEWNGWRSLDTPRFIERWHARMRQLGFAHSGPPHGPEGDPRSRAAAPEGPRPDPERVRELLDRLRPDPSWFDEFSKLDHAARREAIEARLRERALEVLERAPDLVPPERLAQLKTLRGREFLDAVHDSLRELAPPPPHPEHDGRGPHLPDLIPEPRSKPPGPPPGHERPID